MGTEPIRCPGCGARVDRGEAEAKGKGDADAPLTCPTCGAGLDDGGKLVHEPAVGP
jgi:DNA-directed RNA polymerase subunit RPC12/RpoP